MSLFFLTEIYQLDIEDNTLRNTSCNLKVVYSYVHILEILLTV